MAKGGLARERFQEKQQYNRIVSQLNQLSRAGFSTEDIRNAGNDAYQELLGGAPAQVTVKDGDTLSTIASQNGTSPQDILAANPELKQIRTGMVITAPKPPPTYAQPVNFNGDVKGGIGVPSAGPVGGVQGGLSPYFNSEKLAGKYTPQAASPFNSGTTVIGNTIPQGQAFDPRGSSIYNYAQKLRQQTPTFGNSVVPIQNRTITTSPTLPQPVAPRVTTPATANLLNNPALRVPGIQPKTLLDANPELKYSSPKLKNQISDLRNRIDLGYTPTDQEIQYLANLGLIKKATPQPAYSGGGGYRGYKRHGRGGGGGGYGGYSSAGRAPTGGTQVQQGDRMPAFSTGSAFNGLVNWRL